MFSDFLEAKVNVRARAGTHPTYTTLRFGFQIKEYGRRCLHGESECVGREWVPEREVTWDSLIP